MGGKARSRQAHTNGIRPLANMAITPRQIPLRLQLRRKLQPQVRNWRQVRAQCPLRSHPTLPNLQYRGDACSIAGNCVELTNSFTSELQRMSPRNAVAGLKRRLRWEAGLIEAEERHPDPNDSLGPKSCPTQGIQQQLTITISGPNKFVAIGCKLV